MKAVELLCTKCSADVGQLVQGYTDPRQLRCPKCGHDSFTCGYCHKTADNITKINREVTWNCKEGCNP